MASLTTKSNSLVFPRMNSIFLVFSNEVFFYRIPINTFNFHGFPFEYRLFARVFVCLKLTFVVFFSLIFSTDLLPSNWFTWLFHHRKWSRCVALSVKSITNKFSSVKPLSIFFQKQNCFWRKSHCRILMSLFLQSIQIAFHGRTNNFRTSSVKGTFFWGEDVNTSFSINILPRKIEHWFLYQLISIFIAFWSLTKNFECHPWMKKIRLTFW